MLTAFNIALSGLDANGTMLSAISDNIANENTTGFKASTVSFGDVLSQTLTGADSPSQIGLGVQVDSVSPVFTQGSFQTTTNALDLAIDGNGFFIVKQGNANAYTRAGQFSLDKNGNIVNPDGLVLQGYLADALGNITGTLGDLNVSTAQSPAKMTTSVDLAANLDSTQTVLGAAFTLDGNGDSVPNNPANYNEG
ncbi:MAG: flagellar hook-basal body complex protein [Ignavibacteriales bacterium]